MRVYRALVALALRASAAQSIFSLDAAFRDLVTVQQPQVAAQLPAGGDVSPLLPMRSMVGFLGCWLWLGDAHPLFPVPLLNVGNPGRLPLPQDRFQDTRFLSSPTHQNRLCVWPPILLVPLAPESATFGPSNWSNMVPIQGNMLSTIEFSTSTRADLLR
jgi:hypothetical protein